MRTHRRTALALSALTLAGVLTACSDDSAEDVDITNDPGASPAEGDPVAPEVESTP